VPAAGIEDLGGDLGAGTLARRPRNRGHPTWSLFGPLHARNHDTKQEHRQQIRAVLLTTSRKSSILL
jgi:hypothetical protein